MVHDESTDQSSAELQPFAYQVGGHKGMQTIGDGALIVKPALPLELQFYQNVMASPALSSLRPWVPTYLGTLRLEGQNTAEGIASVEDIPETEKDECSYMIVLENVAEGIRKPNILDVKLGTVLYDEEAPPEKKERMEKKARNTTSGEVGIRLTGFQVFGNKTQQPLVVPKDYGKSICAAELPTGIARFFPVHDSTVGSSGSERLDVGLPNTLLVPILISIRKSIQDIRDVLSSIELRMVGSSLLIVYEGDWDRAETGVQWLAKQSASMSSEGDGGDGEEINEDTEVEGWEEDEESEEDGSDEESEMEMESPCVVRLIDFAHTRLKPGEGPDEGLLKGLDTLLTLLDGRIASLA